MKHQLFPVVKWSSRLTLVCGAVVLVLGGLAYLYFDFGPDHCIECARLRKAGAHIERRSVKVVVDRGPAINFGGPGAAMTGNK